MENPSEELLKDVLLRHAEMSLQMLDYRIHVNALEETLFYLDHRARDVFEGHLAIQQAAAKEQREALQKLLPILGGNMPRYQN